MFAASEAPVSVHFGGRRWWTSTSHKYSRLNNKKSIPPLQVTVTRHIISNRDPVRFGPPCEPSRSALDHTRARSPPAACPLRSTMPPPLIDTPRLGIIDDHSTKYPALTSCIVSGESSASSIHLAHVFVCFLRIMRVARFLDGTFPYDTVWARLRSVSGGKFAQSAALRRIRTA